MILINIFKAILTGIVFFPAVVMDLSKSRTDWHGNKLDRNGKIIYNRKQKKYLKALSKEERKKYE